MPGATTPGRLAGCCVIAAAPYHAAMPVYLHDEPIDLTAATLGQLVHAANAKARESDRIVVEVQVGGEALSGEALGTRATEPFDSALEYRFLTATPAALAVETLHQVRDRLGEAAAMQEQAATAFQRDEPRAGFQTMSEVMGAWLQVQQAVLNAAGLCGVTLDTIEIDGEPMSTLTEGLIAQLGELKEMVAAGDSVALADAMAYEWPETARRWDRMVEVLIERVQAAG